MYNSIARTGRIRNGGRTMKLKRPFSASGFVFVVCMLCALFVVGLFALRSDPASAHAMRSGASYAVSLPRLHDNPIEVGVPMTTPTAIRTNTATPTPTSTRLPDLVGNLAWARFCITPGLQVTTSYIGGGILHPPAGPSTMRLENHAGDFIDFPVPQLMPGHSYTANCDVVDCLPAGWLLSMPFTLTVDYFNVVREHNETNNTYVLTIP